MGRGIQKRSYLVPGLRTTYGNFRGIMSRVGGHLLADPCSLCARHANRPAAARSRWQVLGTVPLAYAGQLSLACRSRLDASCARIVRVQCRLSHASEALEAPAGVIVEGR
jgi:hypothetical protein